MNLAVRSAAQVLVDQLVIHGATMAFCVPGESFLDVLDALYERRDCIRLISARHEGGAAFMAEAYAKVTGAPGICLVTRGPGASNAMGGIQTAFHDETPLILLIGQVIAAAVNQNTEISAIYVRDDATGSFEVSLGSFTCEDGSHAVKEVVGP